MIGQRLKQGSVSGGLVVLLGLGSVICPKANAAEPRIQKRYSFEQSAQQKDSFVRKLEAALNKINRESETREQSINREMQKRNRESYDYENGSLGDTLERVDPEFLAINEDMKKKDKPRENRREFLRRKRRNFLSGLDNGTNFLRGLDYACSKAPLTFKTYGSRVFLSPIVREAHERYKSKIFSEPGGRTYFYVTNKQPTDRNEKALETFPLMALKTPFGNLYLKGFGGLHYPYKTHIEKGRDRSYAEIPLEDPLNSISVGNANRLLNHGIVVANNKFRRKSQFEALQIAQRFIGATLYVAEMSEEFVKKCESRGGVITRLGYLTVPDNNHEIHCFSDEVMDGMLGL